MLSLLIYFVHDMHLRKCMGWTQMIFHSEKNRLENILYANSRFYKE